MMTEIPFELDTNDSRSWLIMGIELLHELGKPKEALRCFEKSLELDPDNLITFEYMAYALKYFEKNREALGYYEKILSINPSDSKIWNKKGVLLALYMGNGKDAIESLKKAIELNPKNDWYYYNLVMVLSDSEKYDEALDFANKCLQFSPDFEPVLYCKIHILENMCKYNEVLELCNSLSNTKYSSRIEFSKANALANLKRFKEAVIWYDKNFQNQKHIGGIENKKRALDAIKTGKISDIPFTHYPDGRKFNFSSIGEKND